MATVKYKDPATGEVMTVGLPTVDAYSKSEIDNMLANVGGGGMDMELLWENPAPTAEFAAQTITVPNLSDYPFFMVLTYFASDDSEAQCTIYPTEMKLPARSTLTFIGSDNAIKVFSRTILATNNTITFGAGKSNYSTGGDIVQVPRQIYGIKLDSSSGSGGSSVTMDEVNTAIQNAIGGVIGGSY